MNRQQQLKDFIHRAKAVIENRQAELECIRYTAGFIGCQCAGINTLQTELNKLKAHGREALFELLCISSHRQFCHFLAELDE